MGIVVIGAVYVDIKGYPEANFIPGGRNAGRVERIYGGVSRNVTEDIANCELRPTFVSLVDDTGTGADVIRRLSNHKVDTRYVRQVPDGVGTWLAVFDNDGDVVASISKRPNLMPILDILEEQGDEIFAQADSIVIEVDVDKAIMKKTLALAKKYEKQVYGQEAGLLFCTDFSDMEPEELAEEIARKIIQARIPRLIVTMGCRGAVYADMDGNKGWCPARAVEVKDTTGAGDSFCAGLAVGLTYGKTLREACEIGTHLAASVIVTTENVCPRFLPRELGLDMDVPD